MRHLLLVMVTALVLAPTGRAATPVQPRSAAVRAAADVAFDAAYNLNYDEAMRLGRQLVAAHPDESAAHRALATVVWMHLLFDRGAFTIDHYLGSVTQSNILLPPPPADRAQLFRLHVNRAIALADARLVRAPNDIEALRPRCGPMTHSSPHRHGGRKDFVGFGRRAAHDAHEWVLTRRLPPRRGVTVGNRYAVRRCRCPNGSWRISPDSRGLARHRDDHGGHHAAAE
jgi:hypothetical protein